MNIALGLKRLTAAFLGLVALALFVFGVTNLSVGTMAVAVVGALVCYALFRLVCWIIDGFASS